MSLDSLKDIKHVQEKYFFRVPHAYIIADYIWPGIIMSAPRVMDIKNIKFNPDDIVIASYPKSGTTWMCELVTALTFGGDTDALRKIPQEERVTWLELENNYWWVKIFNYWMELFGRGGAKVRDLIKRRESSQRRVFFTHLPLELLPESLLRGEGRLIYVARNPKDNAVSFFHFHRMARFLGRQKDMWWNDFFALYMTGSLYCGSWFEHVLGYWRFAQGKSDRVLFVKFEDMKKELSEEIYKIIDFLQMELNEEQVAKVIQHCTFDSMKNNKMANRDMWLFDQTVSKFMRKGKVGDWRDYFTYAQNDAFEELYAEKMSGSGLNFQFNQ